MSIFTPIYIVAYIVAMIFNWSDPTHEYNSYCTANNSYCTVEQEWGPEESYIVFRIWPTECVNGRYIMVNRTGVPSGREDVFDVGPWNSPDTTFGGCEEGTPYPDHVVSGVLHRVGN